MLVNIDECFVNIDECFVNKGEKYVNIRENKRKKTLSLHRFKDMLNEPYYRYRKYRCKGGGI